VTEVTKDGRVTVGDGTPQALVAEATWDPGPTNADLAVFICTSAGTVVSQEHFVFFNNKVSPERAVFLLENYAGGLNRGGQVMLDLTALPPEAERIDVVLVAAQVGQTLKPVTDIRLDVWDPNDGEMLTSFPLGDGDLCKCLTLAASISTKGDGSSGRWARSIPRTLPPWSVSTASSSAASCIGVRRAAEPPHRPP
jgi:stress response protein SCP2